MKKRILSILAAAALVLTGCSANNTSGGNSTPANTDQSTAQENTDNNSANTPDSTPAENSAPSENDPLAKFAGTTVKLGIMGASDELVWDPIIAEFAEKDITIKKVFFTDYTQPNAALDAGEIDINSFQHHKYFNNELATFGYDLTAIGDTLLTALNLYSKKITNVDEIKEGDKIAIPNDLTNQSRALSVIQAAGLIKLDPDVDNPEADNIIENPLGLEFVQVDASQTASLLPDVAAAIINGAYAIDAGLSPRNDSIFFDDPSFYNTNDYINIIAARTADKDNELLLAIVKAYQSERTKEIYANDFEGSYIPGWKD